MDLSEQRPQPPQIAGPKRAIRLSPDQLNHLAAGYRSGSTVYELADEFGIERRTVAVHLKRQGVPLRRQSPTTADVEQMVRLYGLGLSLEAVGKRLGFVARTVQRHLDRRGVKRRDIHGR